jgi:hypothetical protein
MNIVPGSSFFQTVGGSAARPEVARPSHGASQILQAQAVDGSRRADQSDGGGAPTRTPGVPYGPRGSLIDIIA